MELPELKKAKRDPGYPDVFEWMQMKMGVYTPILCFVSCKKNAPGAVGLFFQSAEFRQLKKFYIPWFEQLKQANELLNRVCELQKMYEVKNIYTHATQPDRDFLRFFNGERKHYNQLSILPVPNLSEKGIFNYHSDLLMQLQAPGAERVFFAEGSEIPSHLAAIPEYPGEMSDAEYPAAACVCYGIAAAYHNEVQEPEASWKKKKPWSPWAALEDPKFDPDRSLNGDYDIYRSLKE